MVGGSHSNPLLARPFLVPTFYTLTHLALATTHVSRECRCVRRDVFELLGGFDETLANPGECHLPTETGGRT